MHKGHFHRVRQKADIFILLAPFDSAQGSRFSQFSQPARILTIEALDHIPFGTVAVYDALHDKIVLFDHTLMYEKTMIEEVRSTLKPLYSPVERDMEPLVHDVTIDNFCRYASAGKTLVSDVPVNSEQKNQITKILKMLESIQVAQTKTHSHIMSEMSNIGQRTEQCTGKTVKQMTPDPLPKDYYSSRPTGPQTHEPIQAQKIAPDKIATFSYRLRNLINHCGIDSDLCKPDYEIAEMMVKMIYEAAPLPETKVSNFEKMAKDLWIILDDIDTATDWTRGDTRSFYDYVTHKLPERFKYFQSEDG